MTWLTGAFALLHFGVIGSYLWRVAGARPKRGDLLFWALLFLLLLLPGAYLEYPSDAWEHVRRILRWATLSTAWEAHPDISTKLGYFWSWTWIHWLSAPGQRQAFDLLAAFWQLLVAIQVYRLARQGLQWDEAWARALVLIVPFFWGSNVFGLRYYALSSTPLAYASFLALVVWCLAPDRHWWRPVGYLLLTLANHRQETVFCLATLFLAFVWPRLPRAWVKKALVAGLAIGPLVTWFLPGAYGWLANEARTPLGTLNVLGRAVPYLETLGIPGLLGLAGAVALRKTYPLFFRMTLAAQSVFFFPPFVLVVGRIPHGGYLVYRCLLLFPLSFWMLAWLREKRVGVIPATLVLSALALPYQYPWRGRLWFQLHSTTQEVAHDDLLPVADWLRKNRSVERFRRCTLVADEPTRVILGAYLGFDEHRIGNRFVGARLFGQDLTSVERLRAYMLLPEYCGALISTRAREYRRESWVGRTSGHWDPRAGQFIYYGSDGFYDSVPKLSEEGYRVTAIPPHFLFVENTAFDVALPATK